MLRINHFTCLLFMVKCSMQSLNGSAPSSKWGHGVLYVEFDIVRYDNSIDEACSAYNLRQTTESGIPPPFRATVRYEQNTPRFLTPIRDADWSTQPRAGF